MTARGQTAGDGTLDRLPEAIRAVLGDEVVIGTPAVFPTSVARVPQLLEGLNRTALDVGSPAGKLIAAWDWSEGEGDLDQIARAVADALGFADTGRPDDGPAEPADYLGEGTHLSVEVSLETGAGDTTLLLILSGSLREELSGLDVPGGVGPARETRVPEGGPGEGGPDLDVILDIPLEITVRLGGARRPIRDVLALGTGSAIELDRQAGEPVDVLVNGQLMARGEVVVIDGNFGVRITDIESQQERISKLG